MNLNKKTLSLLIFPFLLTTVSHTATAGTSCSEDYGKNIVNISQSFDDNAKGGPVGSLQLGENPAAFAMSTGTTAIASLPLVALAELMSTTVDVTTDSIYDLFYNYSAVKNAIDASSRDTIETELDEVQALLDRTYGVRVGTAAVAAKIRQLDSTQRLCKPSLLSLKDFMDLLAKELKSSIQK